MSRKHVIYDSGQLKSHFSDVTSQQRITLGKFDAFSVAAFSPEPGFSGTVSNVSTVAFSIGTNFSTPINNIAVALEGDWNLNQVTISYIDINGDEIVELAGLEANDKLLIIPALAAGQPDPVFVYNFGLGENTPTIDPGDYIDVLISFPNTTMYLLSPYDGSSNMPMTAYTLSGPDPDFSGTEFLYAYGFEMASANHQPVVCGAGFSYNLNSGTIGIPSVPPMNIITTTSELISSSGTRLWTQAISHQRLYGVKTSITGLTAGQTATLRLYGDSGLTDLQYEKNFTNVDTEDTVQSWRYRNIEGDKFVYIQVENTSGSAATVSVSLEMEPF